MKTGDYFVVRGCKSFPQDRSYRTDIFRVVMVDGPMVAAKLVHSQYGLARGTVSFDSEDWTLHPVSEQYVQSVANPTSSRTPMTLEQVASGN